MGNKLGRRRQVVDEKYTKPQGLYQIKDVDQKRLRKLILESKLAPCYPGDEENGCDLEECPICFLYYPSLNRSRCCMKSICTECFLQMKTPHSARPTQCPFCKTSNYAVEYRGMKTKEEKGMEQIEEQRVIEAKIRMRHQEIRDEEERMLKRQELSFSSQNREASEGNCSSIPVASSRSSAESEEVVSSHESYAAPMIRHPSETRTNRDDDLELDLEDIMVMEAIWLSMQDNGTQQLCSNPASPEQFVPEDRYVTPATLFAGSTSSPSSGCLASVPALADQQQTGGLSSSSNFGDVTSFNIPPRCGAFYNIMELTAPYYPPERSMDMMSYSRMVVPRNDSLWTADSSSEEAEAGTSYGDTSISEDAGVITLSDETDRSFSNVNGPIVPDNLEEQMMHSMTVPLADARPLSSMAGITWQ